MAVRNFDKWIAALRSGEFEQRRGSLGVRQASGDAYCCLGVACTVAGAELTLNEMGTMYFDHDGTALSPRMMKWLGADNANPRPDWGELGSLKLRDGCHLREITAVGMNDDMELTFEQIADVFEYFGVRNVGA